MPKLPSKPDLTQLSTAKKQYNNGKKKTALLLKTVSEAHRIHTRFIQGETFSIGRAEGLTESKEGEYDANLSVVQEDM